MIARALSICLLVLAWARAALALDLARLPSVYDERVFGTREGLPQTSVYALAQTPDGYLWVGTDGGLARFDGHRFTVWRSEGTPALRIHRVRVLLVDGVGDLWIGTGGGAGLVRYRGGRFETFPSGYGSSGEVDSGSRDNRGDLWFGTPHGIVRRATDGTFTALRQLGPVRLNLVRSIAPDADGALWIGDEDALVRYQDGAATALPSADGSALGPDAVTIPDGSGGVWVGTAAGEIFRARNGRLSRVAGWARGASGAVRALLVARDGGLWVGTDAGLAHLRGDRLEPAPAGSATRQPVEALLEDREGNLWVGTRTVGLVRITEGPFVSVPLAPIADRRATAITGQDDGTLWIGTAGGDVLRLRDGVLASVVPAHGACGDSVAALAADGDGGLWLGGQQQGYSIACHVDARGQTLSRLGRTNGLPRGGVLAIARLPGGEIWIGTTAGLFRVTAGAVERILAAPDEPNLPSFAIHLDRYGVLWIADGGGHGLRFRKDGHWAHLGPEQGLSNGQVFSIDEDAHGALWLGTLRGFSRVADGRVSGWKRAQGFLDDPVFKVVPDAAGDLWLCTPAGIIRVAASSIASGPAGRPLAYTRYGSNSGLAADQCEGGAGQDPGWRGPGGTIWMTVARTVAHVDPGRLPPELPAVQPLIERIALDGRGWEPGVRPVLPPGRGDLEITYTAPWLAEPERLRFRYRLDPFDRDWVEAGDRRAAFYTQVPPGHYTFRVMAGAAESWDKGATVTVTFTLAPWLHQTWWFRLSAALAALAAIGGVAGLAHRRRLHALEAQHRAVLSERSRIARDLHDTLAQGFTGISVQLEAASGWMDESPARARGNLDKARALVRASLADARRAVWDLGPEAVERGGLLAALAEIARGLDAAVAVRMQVNGRPRPLPGPFERALARIAQEALANALRHARAANVSLEISFLDEAVLLKVADDGQGFDPQAPPDEPGHLGLDGIRARARELGAELAITSRRGRGSEIALTVPLPRDATAGQGSSR